MFKDTKSISMAMGLMILFMAVGLVMGTVRGQAAGPQDPQAAVETDQDRVEEAAEEQEEVKETGGVNILGKAFGAAFAIGIVGLAGAFAMGNAISKAADGVARQPEAKDQIQTLLMLGLVFIETVVIYALIVAILIIFVM